MIVLSAEMEAEMAAQEAHYEAERVRLEAEVATVRAEAAEATGDEARRKMVEPMLVAPLALLSTAEHLHPANLVSHVAIARHHLDGPIACHNSAVPPAVLQTILCVKLSIEPAAQSRNRSPSTLSLSMCAIPTKLSARPGPGRNI